MKLLSSADDGLTLMNEDGYLENFDGRKGQRQMALNLALDIRKFEIELYWKRATYFWTFIAAAFAGYALVYSKTEGEGSWLLLIFSCLGFLFSVAWCLVNKGSKFWQNNWERHVDLLEDGVSGPLYKIIISDAGDKNILTAAANYSVSKVNLFLSLIVAVFWLLLIIQNFLPISCVLSPNWMKIMIVIFTAFAFVCLLSFTKSENKESRIKITSRKVTVDSGKVKP